MQRQTKRKSNEEITKANLAKMLGKLKIRVAEREEIWLDALTDLIPHCVDLDTKLTAGDVRYCAELADVVLEVYEERWGK